MPGGIFETSISKVCHVPDDLGTHTVFQAHSPSTTSISILSFLQHSNRKVVTAAEAKAGSPEIQGKHSTLSWIPNGSLLTLSSLSEEQLFLALRMPFSFSRFMQQSARDCLH